jgi:hypothetical protein
MFTLSHYGLMRGQNVRGMELPDLFSLPLEGEGPTDCIAVVSSMRNGKTNAFGKLEYGAMIRAKNVEACGISTLGFYLFERFHLNGENLPNVCDAKQWYYKKVCAGLLRYFLAKMEIKKCPIIRRQDQSSKY